MCKKFQTKAWEKRVRVAGTRQVLDLKQRVSKQQQIWESGMSKITFEMTRTKPQNI